GTLSALYAPVSGTCEVVATSSRVGSGVPPLEGTVTVINAVPLWPSLVAVIVAVPTTTPVTRPVAFTLAMPGVLLAQVTVRPVSGFPFASFGVAVSCTVWPACTDAVAGLTVTAATGTVLTVIVAEPLCPSEVAVIVAAPAATAVTSPLALTVATAVLPLDQVTVRPGSELPFAASGVAASCPAWPPVPARQARRTRHTRHA